MLCVVKKKAGAMSHFSRPTKPLRLSHSGREPPLIPDVSHHQVNHARHRGNGVRPTSCPFQVPSTRFWSKQTSNFLKTLGVNPGYPPSFCQSSQDECGKYLDFCELSSIHRGSIRWFPKCPPTVHEWKFVVLSMFLAPSPP